MQGASPVKIGDDHEHHAGHHVYMVVVGMLAAPHSKNRSPTSENLLRAIDLLYHTAGYGGAAI